MSENSFVVLIFEIFIFNIFFYSALQWYENYFGDLIHLRLTKLRKRKKLNKFLKISRHNFYKRSFSMNFSKNSFDIKKTFLSYIYLKSLAFSNKSVSI